MYQFDVGYEKNKQDDIRIDVIKESNVDIAADAHYSSFEFFTI